MARYSQRASGQGREEPVDDTDWRMVLGDAVVMCLVAAVAVGLLVVGGIAAHQWWGA